MIASAQETPASHAFPDAARASAPSTKAIIHASLCPSGEVDGEERVPADEGSGEGGSGEPRGEEDERHHRDRGETL